jgi:hypothetical protein
MLRIDDFDVDSLITCSQAFERLASTADTMAEAADRIVRYLYDALAAGDGDRATALVRLYKTHRHRDLPPDLQAFAEDAAEGSVEPGTRCLTLLATAGLLPEWNDTTRSADHRAIPLLSAAMVEASPMIAALLRDLGLEVADVIVGVRPELHHERQGVFYVPTAPGSPAVPAQEEFVRRYGIRSVLGCGGVLPDAEILALIIFTTAPVPEATADMFRSLALSLKANLVPFTLRLF